MSTKFDFNDRIDLREVTARVEELRQERDDWDHDDDGTRTACNWETDCVEDAEELRELEALLEELAGRGCGYRWKGDWYPRILIRNSYFTEAMQELVKDSGDLPRELPSYLVIDWEATADNLRIDYRRVDFAGTAFWYR